MFKFKGIDSSTYGRTRIVPLFPRAEKAVELRLVEGADRTEREDLGYQAFTTSAEMILSNDVDIWAFRSWASGDGELSLDGEKYVYAYADSGVLHTYIAMGVSRYVVTITFTVIDPFIYTDEDDVVLTEAGTVTNQGTYHSEPIMIIEGSGEVVIDIDGRTFTYDFLTDSEVVIDSRQKEAYFATNLKNRQMIGEFPYLTSGVNNISWTGTVTSITIQPNSRWL